jgi:hypothetical protein
MILSALLLAVFGLQEFQYGGAAESIGVKNYDSDANTGVTPDWLFPRGMFACAFCIMLVTNG